MYLVDSTNLGHESSNDAGALQEQVWGADLCAEDWLKGAVLILIGAQKTFIGLDRIRANCEDCSKGVIP